MRRQKMADAIRKAEAFAQDPNNRLITGKLTKRAERKLSQMTTKIAFLSQFEKPNKEYHY
jgi:hypothetical protein